VSNEKPAKEMMKITKANRHLGLGYPEELLAVIFVWFSDRMLFTIALH